MQFKHLPLLALASLVSAQDATPQSLNDTLAGNENLTALTGLLATQPALLETLSQASNITLLAPSNEALETYLNSTEGAAAANNSELVAALLSYHVLNGTFLASAITNTSAFVPTLLTDEDYADVTGGQVVEAVTVGEEVVFYSGLLSNASVTTADVNFTGGVVHIIDSVLVIPPSVLNASLALDLTSFRGAVNGTDEIETATAGDRTIFAPNNEAFNNIGSALGELSSEDLANIVEYHIVEGVFYSTSLENGTLLQSENEDQELTITTNENGTVFVNAAEVLYPNILIENGVLHIIDNVLNPENTVAPTEPGAPAFTGSAGTEQPFTSGQPTPTTSVNPTTAGSGPDQSTASEAASETPGAAMPMMTGSVQYAALFGAGAAAYLGF